ncbi:MAG TPA: hypothetical protein GXX72_00590 [Clostridiaceae bacterium]|nr:hypothetical protein [Clostridiaceae bacterium]
MFDDDWFEQEEKKMTKRFGIGAVLAVLINLVFFGGLIYFGFWCLRHFGVF